MRFRALLSALLLSCSPSGAEISPELASEIVAEATTICDALLRKDYDFVVERTNPSLVEMAGGPEATLRLAKQSMQQLKGAGLRITHYSVTPPSVLYESDSEEVAFVPTLMVAAGSDVSVHSRGYLIASRPKGADEWFFADGAGFEDPQAAFKELFPGLPSSLEIPERSNDVREL